ncbi:MAG: hypothetical protein JWM97_1980 [Phycisphaerales bacterium]|nr:hypothetical protein [Phycisphaerales bacterium]
MGPVTHITPRRPNLAWAFCIFAAVIAAVVSGIILRNGIKIPSDGWAYWEGSVSLLNGKGYHHFNGRRIWSWPPGYSIYLTGIQLVGGVSGATLAGANTLLAAVAAFAWSAAFLFPLCRSLESARALRPASLALPLLAVIFIALTVATGFRTAMAHNLVYTIYPMVLYVTYRTLRPEGTDRYAIGLALLNGALMAILTVTHNSFIFLPPLVAILIVFHKGRRPAVRWLAAFVAGVAPLVIWVIVSKYLGQWASHKPGTKPLFTWSQYAHQVIAGVANLLGPSRHHLGQLLLAGACGIIVLCLARSRHEENAARAVAGPYLLLSGGFLGCLYVVFNTTWITEPLYSERFMLFLPLTIFPAAAMLLWQAGQDHPYAKPVAQRPAATRSFAFGSLASAVMLVALAAVPFAAAFRTLHWVREAAINGGAVDLARAQRDQGFGYKNFTMHCDYADGPPRRTGNQILVSPAREVPMAKAVPAIAGNHRRQHASIAEP